MGIIKVEGFNKTFGDISALKDINLDVNKGEVVSIIGPSGSGKSTLLRSLIGLEKGEEGRINIDGNDIFLDGKEVKNLKDILKEMAMVFQNFNLFPHLNVIENITIALREVDKVAKVEAYKRAKDLLKRVGLADKESSYIKELSGGQKQRIAIARALARKPEIILFDEPTSALDPELVSGVLELIASLKGNGITMIIVSHEMSFVKGISDKIVFMEKGEIIKVGKVEEVFNPTKFKRITSFLEKF